MNNGVETWTRAVALRAMGCVGMRNRQIPASVDSGIGPTAALTAISLRRHHTHGDIESEQ